MLEKKSSEYLLEYVLSSLSPSLFSLWSRMDLMLLREKSIKKFHHT
jgi:hypothetical protein